MQDPSKPPEKNLRLQVCGCLWYGTKNNHLMRSLTLTCAMSGAGLAWPCRQALWRGVSPSTSLLRCGNKQGICFSCSTCVLRSLATRKTTNISSHLDALSRERHGLGDPEVGVQQIRVRLTRIETKGRNFGDFSWPPVMVNR